MGDRWGTTMQWISSQFPGVRYREHATRKTRNGQFDKYYTVRYRVNGQRKEERLGWASEGWNAEKAYKVLSEILAGVRTGDGPQSLADKRAMAAAAKKTADAAARQGRMGDMTLEAFFRDIYMPRAKREKRSWLTDEQRIAKAINPALGLYPLRAIAREDIQKFIESLVDGGAAPATVKQYMGIIRRAYNMAQETLVEGCPVFSGQNPATGLRLPAVHNSRERYLTADEVSRLIEAAAELQSPDLHDAIILSLNTGLRLGELMRLRWMDVDTKAGLITVPDEAKRKPGGKVPINAAAMAVFQGRREILAASPEARVFPPVAGGEARNNLSAMFRTVADFLQLNEGITDKRHRLVFHSLRHTFASWLALAGTDIYRIKTLMRHRSISMTIRYAHLIPDATKDAVHNLKPPKA